MNDFVFLHPFIQYFFFMLRDDKMWTNVGGNEWIGFLTKLFFPILERRISVGEMLRFFLQTSPPPFFQPK